MPAPTRTLERPPGAEEPGGPATGGRGPRGSGGNEQTAVPATTPARIAVWLLVGAITALFAAFTSTYLVRRGETDWRGGPLPPPPRVCPPALSAPPPSPRTSPR